jgi:hypothetical protein
MGGISNIKNLKPTANGRYQQGYVNPASCLKLFPSLSRDRIIYRSSYEKKFIYWCENSPMVKYWGSECVEIDYFSKLDQKTHRYFPDYLVELTDGTKIIVEIKPLFQTKPPINENNQWGMKEYIKNICKWKATQEFCQARGLKFKILTENTIDKL